MQIQSSFKDDKIGHLYLVPTPIGNLEDITLRAKRILSEADYVAAEDTRTSGILLEKIGVHNHMLSFHKYNSKERAPELIKLLKSGKNIAEISDAGMPVISDPGYILVQECIKNDIPVIPLPGPSAFATALIASGFDAQPFTYYGFVPRKSSEQKVFFEKMSKAKATSIFYEAPHRLKKTLKSGMIFGSGNQNYWTQVLAGGREKHRFYNPILQNSGHINALKSRVRSMANIPFHSVVIFYGNCELQDIDHIPADT